MPLGWNFPTATSPDFEIATALGYDPDGSTVSVRDGWVEPLGKSTTFPARTRRRTGCASVDVEILDHRQAGDQADLLLVLALFGIDVNVRVRIVGDVDEPFVMFGIGADPARGARATSRDRRSAVEPLR